MTEKLSISIPVFLRGVKFEQAGTLKDLDRASVLLEDDGDCHKFRVAFHRADVKKLMERMEAEGEFDEAVLTLTFPKDET